MIHEAQVVGDLEAFFGAVFVDEPEHVQAVLRSGFTLGDSDHPARSEVAAREQAETVQGARADFIGSVSGRHRSGSQRFGAANGTDRVRANEARRARGHNVRVSWRARCLRTRKRPTPLQKGPIP
ncbi:MAG: hypothetical protein DHS20C15_13550 [Planctomycetota bacterium]|nr:MAG: hypothetical protein DHS20C15_13550 [Planctomycetota bacterium]